MIEVLRPGRFSVEQVTYGKTLKCFWALEVCVFQGRDPTVVNAQRDVNPKDFNLVWVAVKELKSSYYIGETLLFTIYIPIMVALNPKPYRTPL